MLSVSKKSLLRLAAACLALCLAWLSPVPASAGHDPAAGEGKPALLLVTFGTSVPQAQGAFTAIEAAAKARFPGLELRWAYTSKKIRHKLAKEGRNIASPAQALAALADEGYDGVAVQSLHIIAGEEFEGLKETCQRFAGMPKGSKRVELGLPLLASQEDMERAAKALLAAAPKERRPKEALVFMGHGTPHAANATYPAMAYILQKLDPRVSLGTVEGYPGLDEVKAELKARGDKKAWLIPLMSVAGDHAINDMAGAEDDSWVSQLAKAGVSSQAVLKGMAENPAIVDIWLDHLQAALEKLGKR